MRRDEAGTPGRDEEKQKQDPSSSCLESRTDKTQPDKLQRGAQMFWPIEKSQCW